MCIRPDLREHEVSLFNFRLTTSLKIPLHVLVSLVYWVLHKVIINTPHPPHFLPWRDRRDPAFQKMLRYHNLKMLSQVRSVNNETSSTSIVRAYSNLLVFSVGREREITTRTYVQASNYWGGELPSRLRIRGMTVRIGWWCKPRYVVLVFSPSVVLDPPWGAFVSSHGMSQVWGWLCPKLLRP